MEIITEYCTGCRACEQLCPTHSITMQADNEGFFIPVIEQSTCIDCKLCQKRCHQNTHSLTSIPSSVYAFRYKVDDDELFKSASGGAFVALARYVLEQGGIVYGASYVDEDLHVGHVKVNNFENLHKLQSSKYVQSDTQKTYSSVKRDLKEGFYVLFSGTSCQIAGLKSYLKCDYNNLLLVDVICHGVPSPLLFEKYIQWMSDRMSKIITYDFRDKSSGWGLVCKAKAKAKAKALPGLLDPYYYHFLKGNTYRECCYQCKYANPERVSDVTIGDYWGIEKEHPEFYSTKGVSCVLINSEKGGHVFDMVRHNAYVIESSFEKVSLRNGNLLHPTERHPIRDDIYIGINEKPLNQFFDENMKYPRPLKMVIKSYIPRKLKLILKKVLIFISCLMLCISCSAERIEYSPMFKCSAKLQNPYGVCSHISRKGSFWDFESRESDLKMIKQTGSSFIRFDFDWVQQQKGKQNELMEVISPALNEAMICTNNEQIRVMGLLSMCKQPYQFEEWKNYVSTVVGKYRDVKYWEVVNEVDLVRKYLKDRKPPFVITDYIPLLKAAYGEIKKSNSKAKVLFSSISNIKLNYVDSLFREDVNPYFDIMNVHWYTHKSDEPETFIEFFEILKRKMDLYNIDKPVWLTETGASTYEGSGVTESMQDNRLPRIFLVSFALGMDKVFWYKSRSNELSTDNVECHYGLWHKDYTPKPAFYAYQTLTRMCPDKSIRPKLVRYGKVYMASWRRPDKKKVWALWTSKADKTISINVKGEYTAYNHHGSKLEILPDDVRLSPSVIYIVGARSVSVE